MPMIAVLGDCFLDVLAGVPALPEWGQDVPTLNAIQMQPGGSGLNTATHLANLSNAVSFFSVMGDDEFGSILHNHLTKHHVESHAKKLSSHPTGVCIVLSGNGDRAFVTHYGAVHAFAVEHIAHDRLHQANHLHIGGFYSCPGLIPGIEQLIRTVKSYGITISLDVNYDGTEKWGHLDKILPLIDVFMPNEVEAMKISKTTSVEAALQYFADQGIALTVIKVGKDGVRAINANTKEKYSHPIFPTEVVDATGAGDAFNAGFLHAWTKDKTNIQQALCYGCALGSACVSRVGACISLPEPNDIHQLVQKV
ncbi:hypothetical protein THRCLA_00675 [Thraustotheca clavata]|uniref:Carbohydrate kinase PfkB domain-containing protein n=1 Tax=Thraustotheca clavata TaxID=74557 RepID=A0A1W0AAK7_9STRA|nr:hypothetical protein THRCLA_00675 [Thraustotheca clavata]